MSHGPATPQISTGGFGNSLGQTKPKEEETEFDITAMVDLIFLLNNFFLISWVAAMQADVDLPSAKHCVGADPDMCVNVVLVAPEGERYPKVMVGDDEEGITDRNEISQKVEAAIRSGLREGKDTLMIRAEKKVKLKDISHVASVLQGIDGVKLRLAVMEKE